MFKRICLFTYLFLHISYILLLYDRQIAWLMPALSRDYVTILESLEIIFNSENKNFKNHKAKTKLCDSYQKKCVPTYMNSPQSLIAFRLNINLIHY